MLGQRWLVFVVPLTWAVAGCQGGPSSRTVASAEPGLAVPADPKGAAVVDQGAAREVTFADRHPLFAKPREYYESSGNNRVVKATAATVIGIPAGLYGEL